MNIENIIFSILNFIFIARVVELVDTTDLKSVDSDIVRVRFPPRVQNKKVLLAGLFCFALVRVRTRKKGAKEKKGNIYDSNLNLYKLLTKLKRGFRPFDSLLAQAGRPGYKIKDHTIVWSFIFLKFYKLDCEHQKILEKSREYLPAAGRETVQNNSV